MKVIVDVVLMPGMITVVDGVIVNPVPDELLPVQNRLPKLALTRFKALFPDAPPVEFH